MGGRWSGPTDLTGFGTIFLCSLTGPRNNHFIATNNHNLLSSKKLLGYNTAKSTKEVIATVDDLDSVAHHGERYLTIPLIRLRAMGVV